MAQTQFNRHADAANRPDDVRSRVMDAFRGGIEPVRISGSYRLGIVAVTVLMVLLPVIYLAIIVLVAWGVRYHAVHNTWLFESVRGRAVVLALGAYVAPIVAGGIGVLFMLKPLFSRPEKTQRPVPLERSQFPLLFEFVDRICEIVGSPRPREIALDCQVNASASLRRGWLSMLGNDLTLTIGMPLVAGMNARQFAGVLAHEFGHFAQGAGMRLTYVIRNISFWFTRVVYERDEWDVRLKEWSNIDLRIGWVLYVAQFFVWLTRKVLWVLMMAGHAVSGYMLREMEFDADRYEARMGGSDTFAASTRRLQLLGYAYQGAYADLGDFYREGRLADDFPALILANVDQMPDEVEEHIEQQIAHSKTEWSDTHPCDAERIASADRESAPGVFRLDEPASILFPHYEAVCKRVTLDFYREQLGDELREESLHPVYDLLERQRRENESYKALHRAWQGQFRVSRPFAIGDWTFPPPENAAALAAELEADRQMLVEAAEHYRAGIQRHDELDGHRFEFEHARKLLDANFRVKADNFSRDLTDRTKIQMSEMEVERDQSELEGELRAFEELAAKRLVAGLRLLHDDGVAARLENTTELREEAGLLTRCLRHVVMSLDDIRELQRKLSAFALLLQNIDGNEENEKLFATIRGQMSDLNGRLDRLRRTLDEVQYPFDHAHGEIPLGRFAMERHPDSENPGEIYGAAESLADNTFRLYARLVGQLCVLVEIVEESLGLEPLPEPPDEPPPDDGDDNLE